MKTPRTTPWLQDTVAAGNLAFLCGAGVSVPSGLPLSSEYVDEFVGALIRVAAPPLQLDADARRRLGKHRLEYVSHVVSQTPWVDPAACLDCFALGQPNAMHMKILRCATHKSSPAVILTTNFDNLFERTAEATGTRPLSILEGRELAGPCADSGVIVAKVHGSAPKPVPGKRPELLASIRQVGRPFEKGTEAHLDSLLCDRTVIALGYSGNDHYDIVPYLMRHKFRAIVWVQHDANITGGAFIETKAPASLQFLFRGNDDVFIRAHTADLLLSLEPAQNCSADWAAPLSALMWQELLSKSVDDMGPYSLLVLGDLLMSDNAHELAVTCYQKAVFALPWDSDTRARCKAWRNIATIHTLHRRVDEAIRIVDIALGEPKLDRWSRSELLMEKGLAINRLSVWEPKHQLSALAYIRQAFQEAEKVEHRLIMGLASHNEGRVLLQMTYNKDLRDEEGRPKIEANAAAAVSALERAYQILWPETDLQNLSEVCKDLADCYIVLNRCKEAVRFYTQTAWFARIKAYVDNGETLKLLLAHVGSATALAIYVGSKFDDLFDWPTLGMLGAAKEVLACIREGMRVHVEEPWEVNNSLDILDNLGRQAHDFANRYFDNWSYE